MIARIESTPIAKAAPAIPKGTPRRIDPNVLAAVLPGPGRDRLAAGEVRVVTTGQQPGLFTGPLYTINKALSAIALAARLERERGVPVVPVFWVAGDDHDFAEGNHAWVLNGDGEPVKIVLRERPHEAPQLPLFREPCGPEIRAALDALNAALPETEFKRDVITWLESTYRPETSLADAAANALHQLLAARGPAIFRAYDPAAKRAAAPWLGGGLGGELAPGLPPRVAGGTPGGAAAPGLVRRLDAPPPAGLRPVLVEGTLGRDRLRAEGDAAVARRSGEQFSRAKLEQMARETPERLSPNVLLRPVIEAALFPTVAYVGGPGEMEYLPESKPLFAQLGVTPQAAVPRWSGMIIEARVDKVLAKHGLTVRDFDGQPGALESRMAGADLPPDPAAAAAEVRAQIETRYGTLATESARVDPTLERTVQSARNAALGGTHEIEKKLVASVKRAEGTTLSQLARARGALMPGGEPQERVLTVASFLARYGASVLEDIAAEVARWAASL